MAQTIAYWQNKMLAAIAADTTLSTMNSPSQVAVFRLFTFIFATCVNLFEQVLDIFKTEVEEIATEAVPGTDSWVQNEVLKFQYSSTTAQVVQLVDFAPFYPIVDTLLQIITRCSVKTLPNKVVAVKVAKSEPPAPLSAPELASLIAYLDAINFSGVQPDVISLDADKLNLVAEIYYNGAYSPVISANVIAAINTFLADLPFDGILRVSKLIDAIQSVEGVTDVVINDLAMRADTVAFVSRTFLVQGNDTFLNKYPTSAGYIVEETEAGQDFATTLTFIVE